MATSLHSSLTGPDLHISKLRNGTGSPIGVLTPSVIGEAYVDLNTGIIFSANGVTNTSWVVPVEYSGVQLQAIINGGFAVNQRVVSGTVTLAAGVYGHDRWKAGASGCTYTFATSLNVTTITISAGSLIQVIEGNNLTSGTYTLSWTGTVQGKIGAGSFSASGITGTAVGGTNLNIEFGTGTVSKVQFNIGSVPFLFQPKSFNDEFNACMRYYEKTYNYTDAPGTITNTSTYSYSAIGTSPVYSQPFRVRKRAAPTIVYYSSSTGATGKIRNFATSTDFTVTTGNNGESIFSNNCTGVTQGDLMLGHWTAESEL